MRTRSLVIALLLIAAASARAADYPQPTQGDYTIRDFHFRDGKTLPELRMHYRTLGEPKRDAQGIVRNAVLIMHGTTGSGAQFIRPEFAGELFGKGQLLDAQTHFSSCRTTSAMAIPANRATACTPSFPTTAIAT